MNICFAFMAILLIGRRYPAVIPENWLCLIGLLTDTGVIVYGDGWVIHGHDEGAGIWFAVWLQG
jgi:hypothetical protein